MRRNIINAHTITGAFLFTEVDDEAENSSSNSFSIFSLSELIIALKNSGSLSFLNNFIFFLERQVHLASSIDSFIVMSLARYFKINCPIRFEYPFEEGLIKVNGFDLLNFF